MEYFNKNEAELKAMGAIHTAKEISSQPEVWDSTYKRFMDERTSLAAFRKLALANCQRIILTGAGTSAYIGDSLEGSFLKHTGLTTLSVPTTHLVTHPGDYTDINTPTLVISFARSGNSPESVAAVKRIDKVCKTCFHLIITCDKDGELAKYKSENQKFIFILPPESNDKSLAMTSSYTSMMLSGLLFARMDQEEETAGQVKQLCNYGKRMIQDHGPSIRKLAEMKFQRAIFLGSGPLFGTSTESSLKLMELTDGTVICKNDSFLGFRHGPKAVIDEKSIVIFLFSNVEEVQQYERDLVRSMDKGKKALFKIGVAECSIPGIELDECLCFSCDENSLDEEFLAICSVLPAQMLGLFKSISLGLKPDNPSVSGAISRVVEGVVIYD